VIQTTPLSLPRTGRPDQPTHVYLVRDDVEIATIMTQSHRHLSRQIVVARNWAEVTNTFRMHPRSICVDFQHLEDTALYDITNTVATLSRLMGLDHTVTITLGVGWDTPLSLIRAARKNRIFGIVPTGQDYGVDECLRGMYFQWDGLAYWPQHIIRTLRDNTKPVAPSQEFQLTERQQQIFDLVTTRGCSNKQLARFLDLSESTVKLHMGAIFKKYGVKNRTQLAVFAKPATQ